MISPEAQQMQQKEQICKENYTNVVAHQLICFGFEADKPNPYKSTCFDWRGILLRLKCSIVCDFYSVMRGNQMLRHKNLQWASISKETHLQT